LLKGKRLSEVTESRVVGYIWWAVLVVMCGGMGGGGSSLVSGGIKLDALEMVNRPNIIGR